MKKPIVLIVVQVILIIILISLGRSRKDEQYQVQPLWTPARVDEAQSIILRKKAEQVTLQKKGADSWVLASNQKPVKMEKLDELLEDLKGLRLRELISSDAEKETEFGLDSAQVGMIGLVQASGDTAWVEIGRPDSRFTGQFIRKSGESLVYKTPGILWLDTRQKSWEEPPPPPPPVTDSLKDSLASAPTLSDSGALAE